MRYFVHIADPSFPEPPWPNARRLGPFDTLEEAEAQLVSDLANGHLGEQEVLGIHDEQDSHALSVAATAEVADHFNADKLRPRVEAVQAGQAEERRRVAAEAATRAAGVADGTDNLLEALVAAGVLRFPDDQLAALKQAGLL